jgi:hypothetical protein
LKEEEEEKKKKKKMSGHFLWEVWRHVRELDPDEEENWFSSLVELYVVLFLRKKEREGLITTSYKDVAKKMDASKAITPATELPLPPFLIFMSLGEFKAVKKAEYWMMTMMLVSRITESRSAVCSWWAISLHGYLFELPKKKQKRKRKPCAW